MENSIYNYIFDIDKKDEFLKGRKIVYLANSLDMSCARLSEILNAKRTCNRVTAIGICTVFGYNGAYDYVDWFKYIR